MFGIYLENLRLNSALVHSINNYVTANDCANVLLACGASPIMSDDLEDAIDIIKICDVLNINIGTLNTRITKSMIACGMKANELNKLIILDPVGLGASRMRNKIVSDLISKVKINIIKGNISEIKNLIGIACETRGVDANLSDKLEENNLEKIISITKKFCEAHEIIIVITGEIDLVCDKNKAYIIHNGNFMMSKITGAGCMLSVLISAFVAKSNNLCDATAAAVIAMGLCGEKAYARMSKLDGNASYKNYLLDEIYKLNARELDAGAKYKKINL